MAALLLLTATSLAGPADYDNSPTIGPARGWLLIHGGGSITRQVKQRFIGLAGGPDARIVVIPTAQGTVDEGKEWKSFSRSWGVKHLTVLHTNDRSRADSRDFTEPLRQASGVWISGGRQWRLTDAYLGTAVEREIKSLLARGGVVGGSSAGATIQGSYLVRGAPGVPGNPNGNNRLMMVPGHETGFALLPNSAIDQHVIARRREADLEEVISSHPKLLGIGIDEGTAILVHGDKFELIAGRVIIHDGKKHDGKGYYYMSQGQAFNLRTREAE